MSRFSKLVWSEGLFLQPQHFQQQDRHTDHEIRMRQRLLSPHAHGFVSLELDASLLTLNQLGIAQAEGFFPDGTYFHIPHTCAAPRPVELSLEQAHEILTLCLPLGHGADSELDREPAPAAHRRRYQLKRISCNNVHEDQSISEDLEVAEIQPVLRHGGAHLEGLSGLGLAKLQAGTDAREAILDKTYIPPLLDCHASPVLLQLIRRVRALLEQKIRQDPSQEASTADARLREAAHRHHGVFHYMEQQKGTHPESLYRECLRLRGDAWAATRDLKQAAELGNPAPPYMHHDLASTFAPLLSGFERVFCGQTEARAQIISLQERQFGVFLGQISQSILQEACDFILAVHAQAPLERTLREFPHTVKIGSPNRIRELVNLNLPSIPLKALAHPPRELPFYAEHVYFQLDIHHNNLWEEVRNTQYVAIHSAAPLAGLKYELWAIRTHGDMP